MIENNAYLKLEEVAQFAGLGKSTIWRLVANGQFPPPHKFGRSSRWLLSDIINYGQQTVLNHPNNQPIPASLQHAQP